MKLQNLIDEISSNYDNKNILFGDFLDNIRLEFSNKTLNCDFFDTEPDWNDLQKEQISFYVSCFHYLCHEFGIKVPKWIFDEKFVLEYPLFAMNAKGNLRITLLAESPKEFRIRNIFVTNNVLRRV